jgi:hypothetical protein
VRLCVRVLSLNSSIRIDLNKNSCITFLVTAVFLFVLGGFGGILNFDFDLF